MVYNRPEPMGVMTFTRIDKNKVVIYAGNYQVLRSDDLFIFNLETKVSKETNETRYHLYTYINCYH